jgi:hypothetical protein
MSKHLLQISLIRAIRNIVETSIGIKQPPASRKLAELLLEDLVQEHDVLTEFYDIRFDHLAIN